MFFTSPTGVLLPGPESEPVLHLCPKLVSHILRSNLLTFGSCRGKHGPIPITRTIIGQRSGCHEILTSSMFAFMPSDTKQTGARSKTVCSMSMILLEPCLETSRTTLTLVRPASLLLFPLNYSPLLLSSPLLLREHPY